MDQIVTKRPRGEGRSTWPDSGIDIDAVAYRLWLTREALKLSKSAFARRAGLLPNLYGQYENAKRPLTIGSANQIADAHGVSLDWLYRGRLDKLPDELADKIAELRARK